MKSINKLILCFFLLTMALFALPGQVNAAPLPANSQSQSYSDKVVFGDTFFLMSGDVLDGNLTILGGTVTLENNSEVTGDVVLLGGTLNANGNIMGNLSTLGGSLFLGDQAIIHGNLSMLGGGLHRSSQSQVLGQTVNGGINPFNINLPSLPFNINLFSGFQSLFTVFRTFVNIIILSALALLVVLVWPRPTERVAQAIGTQPVITGGLGLLTAVVLPALLIVLLITIILIPVSLLGFLALGIAILFGWFGVGLEVGKRLGDLLKVNWQPALLAGMGTLTISLIASFIGAIPCVGWLVPFLIAMVGLGGVIITQFGSKFYPPSTPVTGSMMVTPGSTPPTSTQPPSSMIDRSEPQGSGEIYPTTNSTEMVDPNSMESSL